MNKKVELLSPAGDIDCFSAAISAGVDAVYLGLDLFSARSYSENFTIPQLEKLIIFAHKKNVKVYLALNTLIKNSEFNLYFENLNKAVSIGIDAVIIQSQSLVGIIRKLFPSLKIHLSTQATITNNDSILNSVDRVIPAREISLDDIKKLSSENNIEIFVHGALCISYSGQCLFSSFLGGRSGNRGRCAQPCRKKYNNKYNLSPRDLCLIEEIPKLISLGIRSFKIEGRMRNASYVYFVTSIYRKYIDLYYSLDDKSKFSVSKKDLEILRLSFNRDLTKGFAFEDSILNPRLSLSNGVFLGSFKDNKIKLISDLNLNDGVCIINKTKKEGFIVDKLFRDNKPIRIAKRGDIISLGKDYPDYLSLFKTSIEQIRNYEAPKYNFNSNSKISSKSNSKKKEFLKNINFSDSFLNLDKLKSTKSSKKNLYSTISRDDFKLMVKVYNQKEVLNSDKSKADIIYYDITNPDFTDTKQRLKNSKLYCTTPRILNNNQLSEIINLINQKKPDGVLVSNPGLLKHLSNFDIHLDYSFNIFNDIDLNFFKKIYNSLPIISPELSFDDIKSLKCSDIIILVHGNIIFMTTKQPLTAPELIDEQSEHFLVRDTNHNYKEILNSKEIAVFNHILGLKNIGVRNFYLDIRKDSDKYLKIYTSILLNKKFDDSKIKKGYTLGHFNKGVL
jgi:collagenase-like PrtC family protease